MDGYDVSPFQAGVAESVSIAFTQLVTFLPKLASALLVGMIGLFLARALRRFVINSLSRLKLSSSLEKTPVAEFLKNSEVGHTAESVAGSVVYWIFMLFVIYTVVTILGLDTASAILNRVLFYIPRVVSAILIFIFGVLLAGIAEALVKGMIKSIDPKTGRLVGKISSYLIIVLASMAAISELGIAQQFITILFTGFVVAVSLAIGLAFGLGSKDTVNRMMGEWYDRMRREE
ncbi:hypothetical protein KBD71_03995 [Candidatus Woesebacteria bacterium]|nr:hypothetical protein [Candidatus Woesebacteria bacterium]